VPIRPEHSRENSILERNQLLHMHSQTFRPRSKRTIKHSRSTAFPFRSPLPAVSTGSRPRVIRGALLSQKSGLIRFDSVEFTLPQPKCRKVSRRRPELPLPSAFPFWPRLSAPRSRQNGRSYFDSLGLGRIYPDSPKASETLQSPPAFGSALAASSFPSLPILPIRPSTKANRSDLLGFTRIRSDLPRPPSASHSL
jgi:hypothetical protein